MCLGTWERSEVGSHTELVRAVLVLHREIVCLSPFEPLFKLSGFSHALQNLCTLSPLSPLSSFLPHWWLLFRRLGRYDSTLWNKPYSGCTRACVCVCALAPSIDRLMSLTIEWQFSSLTAFLVCFYNLTLGTGMDIRGVLTKAFLVYSKRLISIWSLQGCAMYLIALIVTPSIGLDTIKHGAN